MTAIDELAKTRGLVGVRVAYKRNARGGHKPAPAQAGVALIFSSFEQR